MSTHTHTDTYTQAVFLCYDIPNPNLFFYILEEQQEVQHFFFFGSLLILFCKEEKERTREYADVKSSILMYIVESFLRLDYPKGSGVFV